VTGRSYLVEAPRTNELVAWLRCNDVNLCDVPYKSGVFVESADGECWVIRHALYTRSATGAVQYSATTFEYVFEWRTVPLVNDPPMWWLVEQKEETAATGDVAVSSPSDGRCSPHRA
jgi:hypothetical protein